MTAKQLVYMCMDELKLSSDDSTFNEDHILFLLNKYRAVALKNTYMNVKRKIPRNNYQTVCLDLIQVPAISGELCGCNTYLRSKEKLPYLMQIGNPIVYPVDYYNGDIAYVSRERMKYVGYNRFLQNVIYCSVGPDNYLYFKSFNPQYLYLEKVNFTGIFQNVVDATRLQPSDSDTAENYICNPMDMEFPLEDALVPIVIEFVVKELTGAIYKPEDDINNAKDDLPNYSIEKK